MVTPMQVHLPDGIVWVISHHPTGKNYWTCFSEVKRAQTISNDYQNPKRWTRCYNEKHKPIVIKPSSDFESRARTISTIYLDNIAHGTAICRNPQHSSNWHFRISKTVGLQTLVLSKCCERGGRGLSLYFSKNVTSWSVGLLGIGQVCVSCKAVYRWVTKVTVSWAICCFHEWRFP